MRKNTISLIVRVFVSASLILILLYIMRGKYADILNALKDIQIPVFALAFLAFLGAVVIASLRLKLIVGAAGKAGIKFSEALSLTFIGYFFNNFLPTAIGGDVVKGYYLSKKGASKMSSYTSVFIDRVIGLVTMIFMATGAMIFAQNRIVDERIRYLIYIITIIAVLGTLFLANKSFARKFSFLLVFARPLEKKIREVYNAVHSYKHNTKLLVQSLIISVVSQIFFFASIGIAALSIGSNISCMDILLRMPIISALSLLPSINGLGLREGSTVLLFGPIIGKDKAFAVSIIWLFILFLISLIGGLTYSLSPQFRMKLKDVEGRS